MLILGIALVVVSVLAHVLAGAEFGGFNRETGEFYPAKPGRGLSPARRVVVFLSWVGLVIGLVLIVVGIIG